MDIVTHTPMPKAVIRKRPADVSEIIHHYTRGWVIKIHQRGDDKWYIVDHIDIDHKYVSIKSISIDDLHYRIQRKLTSDIVYRKGWYETGMNSFELIPLPHLIKKAKRADNKARAVLYRYDIYPSEYRGGLSTHLMTI